MILTFDAFNETIQEAEKTKMEFEEMKRKVDVMFRVIETSQLLINFQEDQNKLQLRNEMTCDK
jgi:hypothetical protein